MNIKHFAQAYWYYIPSNELEIFLQIFIGPHLYDNLT